MSHHLRLSLVPAYLMLCLLLGGASAAGLWANMILQLLAIPIIFSSLLLERQTPMAASARQLILIMILMLLVIGIQLVPLPPSLWASLPGRDHVAEGLRLVGQPLPWLPLSLAPYQTLASALWLLPAVAVVLGIVRLGYFKSTWIAWVIAMVTAAGVLLGAMQVSGGPAWYFYQITNFGFATGFFSNANHMATLLVAAIPFLTALFVTARARRQSAQRSSGMFVILSGAIAVVLAGLLINNSLAGLGLAVPVIAASLLMIRFGRKQLPSWSLGVIAVLTIVPVLLVFAEPFDNNLTSSGVENAELSRYTSFSKSIDAAKDFVPLGSGIGSFAEIYRLYEDPAAIGRTYMNHVHSDYIELFLETGVLGLAVLLLFLLWWGRRSIAIWRAAEPDNFARAASIASAAILAHSLVDYPLRTAAMAAVFALCCALMAEPRAKARRPGEKNRPTKLARHLAAD